MDEVELRKIGWLPAKPPAPAPVKHPVWMPSFKGEEPPY